MADKARTIVQQAAHAPQHQCCVQHECKAEGILALVADQHIHDRLRAAGGRNGCAHRRKENRIDKEVTLL
eukprot:scaffold56428_cov20-Tisochrysis_lutea.AAC.2